MSVHGYVAVTDPGWWQELSRESGPKEANFWKPSTRAVRLEIGTPFFFKLKAPFNAIAGFGHFAGFSVLPDWLAWETFGTANGVPSLEALRDRLTKIRDGARIEGDPGGRIGCSLIAESTFFPRDAWIAPPTGFSPRTQVGSGIDLTEGEGLRIWQQCRARTLAQPAAATHEDSDSRYGTPILRAPRLGQGIFRIRVLDAYGRACAVTSEHSLPVLDAAHIRPYADGGTHSIGNGLALRSDLHRLFDHGYITVDEGNKLVVGDRLRAEFHNGKTYYPLHGRALVLPDVPSLRPDPDALAWHREQRFVG